MVITTGTILELPEPIREEVEVKELKAESKILNFLTLGFRKPKESDVSFTRRFAGRISFPPATVSIPLVPVSKGYSKFNLKDENLNLTLVGCSILDKIVHPYFDSVYLVAYDFMEREVINETDCHY